jgi:hypothetical protein
MNGLPTAVNPTISNLCITDTPGMCQ